MGERCEGDSRGFWRPPGAVRGGRTSWALVMSVWGSVRDNMRAAHWGVSLVPTWVFVWLRGHIWGSQRPLPACVCVGDTAGTPSPAGPGSVRVMGRGRLPRPAILARLRVCADSGEVSGAESPSHVRGRPFLSPPPVRAHDLPNSVAAAGGGGGWWGWGGRPNSRAPSANLGAAKPQTAKLGSPGARPSPDPLPPSLRPRSPRPQPPAGASLTFPSRGGPTSEDLIL